MDKKMIQKLKDAGVGADIILGLILEDEDQIHAEPEQVTPEPAAAQEQEQEPAPAPAPAPYAPDPVLAKLDNLIGAIQASNIIMAGRDSAPQESVDDILAAMITPAKGGNNGTK